MPGQAGSERITGVLIRRGEPGKLEGRAGFESKMEYESGDRRDSSIDPPDHAAATFQIATFPDVIYRLSLRLVEGPHDHLSQQAE